MAIVYHRHLKKWMNLRESVGQMKEFGELWSVQGPFEYCDICRCIPTSYIGKAEEEYAPDVPPNQSQ